MRFFPTLRCSRAVPAAAGMARRGAASSPRAMVLRVVVRLALVGAMATAGCAELRLPAIDPTGERIFLPHPNSTRVTLPRLHGEEGLLPQPAYPEPAPPPPCLEGAPPGTPSCGPTAPCGPACGVECAKGPPAVLFDEHHRHLRQHLQLPDRGRRGCILLSPQRVIAPVGGEVVLLTGVCGNDGYLVTGEPIEWMLTPESVGHFIQVGDEDRTLMNRLARDPRAEKRSGSYARGVTSRRPSLITRGNLNLRDDVPVKKGQTWMTISSPTEGVSKVTVMAPESDCWDQRKATATIYWIDARWQFPGSQIVKAGTPVGLSTRVTRSEGTIPATGWIVRYEILTPELATFAPSGSAVAEAIVDDSGMASVQMVPTPGSSGTATVAMQVIRPAGDDGAIPRMTLGQGRTTVTWTAPRLALRVGGPPVASFDAPVQVFANLANPGSLAAENVQLSVQLPPGVSLVGSDLEHYVSGNQVIWDIGRLPAQNQLDIDLTVSSRATFRLTFQARADDGLAAEETLQVDVFRPSLEVRVGVAQGRERMTVGEEVTFDIDVINTGDQPLTGVQLTATGDEGLIHLETATRQIFKSKDDGPLGPGETWRVASNHIAERPGQRTLSVEATAAGGQRASGRASIVAVNPPPPTPAVRIELQGPRPAQVLTHDPEGQLFRLLVSNSGREPLSGARVVLTYEPPLVPVGATQEGLDLSQIGQYQIVWNVPQVAPGDRRPLEARLRTDGPPGHSQLYATVETAEGARDQTDFAFQIVPGQPPAAPPAVGPALPRATEPPRVPPADPRPGLTPPPLAEERPDAAVTPPPTAAPRSGELRLTITEGDDPVAVGAPLRYRLRIQNDREVPDSQVRMRFRVPPGTQVQRVSQTLFPGDLAVRIDNGVVSLPEINQLRAGETIEYLVEMISNQPQQLLLEVEASSQLTPDGVRAQERTQVLPR